MNMKLRELQNHYALNEGNDIWNIPIVVEQDPENPTNTVLIPDLNAVLLLDFDEQ